MNVCYVLQLKDPMVTLVPFKKFERNGWVKQLKKAVSIAVGCWGSWSGVEEDACTANLQRPSSCAAYIKWFVLQPESQDPLLASLWHGAKTDWLGLWTDEEKHADTVSWVSQDLQALGLSVTPDSVIQMTLPCLKSSWCYYCLCETFAYGNRGRKY